MNNDTEPSLPGALDGRTALITGASGGLGRAIAGELAAHGVGTILTGRREQALKETADRIESEGGRAFILVSDLSDKEERKTLVSKAAELASGRSIDILVNNAGLTRDNLALRMKPEEWDEVISVNLNAVFALTQACLKPMFRQRYGRIINIGSVVGATGNPGQVNYTAAKSALVGLTKSLALECASRGITVNCVAPGFIETDMTGVLDDKSREAILQRVPLGRMGQPEEIAKAVRFLCESPYITGHTLHVNGGMAML